MESGGRVGRWIARVLAILATGALLAVGVAVTSMIRSEADSKAEDQALVAEPTPTPTPKPKPKKKARRATLTKSQRAARTAAVAELRRQGYKPVRLADWHARQSLRVLLGTQGGQRRAFFFVGRRYIGNDTTTPSSKLRVGKQDKRSVTLVYSVWRGGDRACCPHGGTARVRFRWDGGQLQPQSAIPDAAARRPAAA
jgi:LppP/LprE lipoprotein